MKIGRRDKEGQMTDTVEGDGRQRTEKERVKEKLWV